MALWGIIWRELEEVGECPSFPSLSREVDIIKFMFYERPLCCWVGHTPWWWCGAGANRRSEMSIVIRNFPCLLAFQEFLDLYRNILSFFIIKLWVRSFCQVTKALMCSPTLSCNVRTWNPLLAWRLYIQASLSPLSSSCFWTSALVLTKIPLKVLQFSILVFLSLW